MGGTGSFPDLARRAALVTGAGGVVGANLCRALLERGATVHALVRPGGNEASLPGPQRAGLTVHRADLRDPGAVGSALAASGPELIFNLARRRGDSSPAEAAAASEVNEAAVTSLIGLAGELSPKPRLIQLGTALEGRDQGAYARSKEAATALCLEADRSGALPATVLQPVSLYGPWDRPERLIPAAIAAALGGGELPLTPRGTTREWLFVEDLVEACLLASGGGGDGRAVALATGRPWDNLEVVRMVGVAAGRPVAIASSQIEPRHWDRAASASFSADAERLLGWHPRTSLDDGLARTVAWTRGMREAALAG